MNAANETRNGFQSPPLPVSLVQDCLPPQEELYIVIFALKNDLFYVTTTREGAAEYQLTLNQQDLLWTQIIHFNEVQNPPEAPVPEETIMWQWPRSLQGKVAVCGHCGVTSEDLHFCFRCKFRIPNNAKIVNDSTCTLTKIDQNSATLPVQEQERENMKKLQAAKKRTSVVSARGGGKRKEECIVLSSDDEDQSKSKMLRSDGVLCKKICATDLKENSGKKTEPTASQLLLNLRKSVKEEKEFKMELDVEKIEEAIKTSSAKLMAKFECRSIRIGDYKTVDEKGISVVFTEIGVIFSIPHAHNQNQVVKCVIPHDSILIIDAHLQKVPLVLFIYCGPNFANDIRKRIGMGSSPSEIDNFQKRITFLPLTVPEQNVYTLKKIYGQVLAEIDIVKANQILVESSRDNKVSVIKQTVSTPKPDAFGLPLILTRHSTKSTTSSQSPSANTNALSDSTPSSQAIKEENIQLLNYQDIQLIQQDILCLADEQFLNDSIVDLWMRYVEHELLTPEQKNRTYIFNTFFYKRLTTKPKRSLFKEEEGMTNSEKRHSRVKRWTKNVDIFEKDFLVIPICESVHWFLAVICYPGLVGKHNIDTGEPIQEIASQKKNNSNNRNNTNGAALETNAISEDKNDNLSHDSESTPEDRPRIKQPCILLFDSLAGEPRSRIFSTLREYLKIEFKTRKGMERDFTKTTMPSGMPIVPQQPNHCDCGFYTLYFVESFFRDPIMSFEIPINGGNPIWMDGRSSNQREDIYRHICKLIEKHDPEKLPFVPMINFVPQPPAPATPNLLPTPAPPTPTHVPTLKNAIT